jgi:4-amino-4-deoxy-L-arabinose transferase-like glycosyltransferase
MIRASSPQETRFDNTLANYSPLLLTGVAVLLFFPGLGTRDFWDPGEPIYGEAIRVMFEKNNWLIPMVNGHVYVDKPVLYFWLALIISKAAGTVSEWTARLPAALGALGLVLTTYYFGKILYDRRTGLFAGFILATTSRVMWESRFVRLDTLLAFFLLLGFLFFLKAFVGNGEKRLFLYAYFCFALATLTKGPIGVVLPGLAILSLIVITDRWWEISEIRLVSGAALILATILPWLLWLHFHGEDQWLKDFIWIHNVQNYALEPIGHIRPFYYYFLNFPADLLPWTVLLPGALIFYFPWAEKLKNPASLALTCWFAVIFVFFTASKSKIAYYLLPVLPPVALLLSSYLKVLASPGNLNGVHWRCTAVLLYFLALLLFLGGVALPFVIYRLEQNLFPAALVITLILLIGSSVMIFGLRRGGVNAFLWSFLSLILAVSVISSVRILPYLNKYKSPRAIGEFVRTHVPASVPVYIFESTMSDFNYYSRRIEIPVIASEDEITKISNSNRLAYLLVSDKDLKTVKLLQTARDIVTESRVGDKKWYLIRLPQTSA